MAQRGTDLKVREHRVGFREEHTDSDCDGELRSFARGFILTGRSNARFLRLFEGTWEAVTLAREPRPADSQPIARVTATQARLPRGITTREAQVLTLVALGLTNAEISARLGTSARTVSTQVERLLTKLGQTSRAGLAAMAVDAALIVLPIPGGPVDSTSIAQAEIQHAAQTLAPPLYAAGSTDPGFTAHRPIVLATLSPLLGAASSDALELVRGASIAVRELNERGGIDGRPIQHHIEEVDIFDESTVLSALDRIADAGVDAIHSNYVTAEIPAALERIADIGKPFLHTATLRSHLELVKADPHKYGMIFQTCPGEEHYQSAFVDLLEVLVERGSWRPKNRHVVAVEVDTTSYEVAEAGLGELLSDHGWVLESSIRVPVRQPDWQRIADEIIERNPDVVFVAHFLPDVAQLQRLLSAQHYRGLVHYVYAASIRGFQSIAGASSEGILWSTVTGRYADAVGERFQREFALRYGVPPGWSQASAAYDQVMLLANAWTTSGSTEPTGTIDKLRTSIVRGLNGVYYFDNSGQAPLCYPYETDDPSLGQAVFVYQVQNGEPVALLPLPKGDIRRFVAQGGSPYVK